MSAATSSHQGKPRPLKLLCLLVIKPSLKASAHIFQSSGAALLELENSSLTHAADGREGTSEAQQQMEEENQALQAELQSLGEQVRETEKSMSEISALSQMFSLQVSMQSEKTLQLYNQVLQFWLNTTVSTSVPI